MDRVIVDRIDDSSPPPDTAAPPVAHLAFLDRPTISIRLHYPFSVDGAVVETIKIRRLTTDDLIRLADDDSDLFDAYGLMTGLDPTILRGLDADDGDRVTAAAHALLPGILTRGAGSEA